MESALLVRPSAKRSLVDLLANSELVFSAPKYCDMTENKGAYINIGSNYKLDFHQFDAVPHPPIRPMVRSKPRSSLSISPSSPTCVGIKSSAPIVLTNTISRHMPTIPSCPLPCDHLARL